MKDSESGAVPQRKMGTFQIAKKHLLEAKFLMGAAAGVSLLTAILVISLLAAHCGMMTSPVEQKLHDSDQYSWPRTTTCSAEGICYCEPKGTPNG